MDSERTNNDRIDAPVEDGALDATADDKKRGILEQVAYDSASMSRDDTVRELKQRLTEVGVPVDDAELQRLVDSLPSGNWDRAAPAMEEVDPSTGKTD